MPIKKIATEKIIDIDEIFLKINKDSIHFNSYSQQDQDFDSCYGMSLFGAVNTKYAGFVGTSNIRFQAIESLASLVSYFKIRSRYSAITLMQVVGVCAFELCRLCFSSDESSEGLLPELEWYHWQQH